MRYGKEGDGLMNDIKYNWFEKRTIQLLFPYDYNHKLDVRDNAYQEYLIKTMSVFDIPVIIIGVWFLKRKLEKYKNEQMKKVMV